MSLSCADRTGVRILLVGLLLLVLAASTAHGRICDVNFDHVNGKIVNVGQPFGAQAGAVLSAYVTLDVRFQPLFLCVSVSPSLSLSLYLILFRSCLPSF